jgi:DNA polymerase I
LDADDEVAAMVPAVRHVIQDAPFPAVLLCCCAAALLLQVDARAANN